MAPLQRGRAWWQGDVGVCLPWASCPGLLGSRDISLSVSVWSFPSLSAAGGDANKSFSTASILEVRIFFSSVFIDRVGVLEKPLSRFCKLSLSKSTVKSETGERSASSLLAAFGLLPPGLWLGLKNPFLLLGTPLRAAASIKPALCSEGRVPHTESPHARMVSGLLLRAVFCRFLISSRLISSSSSRNAPTETELLPFFPLPEIGALSLRQASFPHFLLSLFAQLLLSKIFF